MDPLRGLADSTEEAEIARAATDVAVGATDAVAGLLLRSSAAGLRIAGGFLVAGIGSTMLLGAPRDPRRDDPAEAEARAKRDVSFSPLALPMLSGPGSIAVTVGFTSLASHWLDYIAIILGILVVAIITYVVLRLAERTVLLVGVNGMNALTKVMGFLILCIGVQFIVNGVGM